MKKEKLRTQHIKRLAEFGIKYDQLMLPELLIYEVGEYLCLEGQPFIYLLLIYAGRSKVSYTTEDGKTLLYCFAGCDAFMGDIELMMDESQFLTNVSAVTRTTCIGIPIAANRSYLKENITFLNHIGRILATKLDSTGKKSTYTALHPVESRLCSYILITSHQGYFTEKLTEVAELLGTSYRHLLRTMEQLCTSGVLHKEKEGYHIMDRSELAARSDEYPSNQL